MKAKDSYFGVHERALTMKNNLLELVQNFEIEVRKITKSNKDESVRKQLKEETE